ncbi:MAG: DUF2238 domain-containing protein [Eubacteriales bacterium]|nr:DUF2238 domain-containing protein [Eubacteriales bacterium]
MQEAREEKFRRINRVLYAVYAAAGILAAVYYGVKGDPFYCFLSVGTLLIFPARAVAYRLMGDRRAQQLEFVIALFVFLSYVLGVSLMFYKVVPYYDKLMHTLSGTLTMLLAFPLFYALKAGSAIEETDCRLAIVFCLMTAVAVAGLWEIVEYFVGMIFHVDNQRVLTTGIADTMQDMIVCTVGALLVVPSMRAYYHSGRRGLLMSALEAFVKGDGKNGGPR